MKQDRGWANAVRDKLIARASGRCQCCGAGWGYEGVSGVWRNAVVASPHIDHDHRTGVLRGVICGSCNRALAAVDAGQQPPSKAMVAYLGQPVCSACRNLASVCLCAMLSEALRERIA